MQLYSLKSWSSTLIHLIGFIAFYTAGFLTCYLDTKIELHRQQLEVYELRLQVEQNKINIEKLSSYIESVTKLYASNQELIKSQQAMVATLNEFKGKHNE